MNISFYRTEDPKAEQWKMLLQYSYLSNINKFLEKNGFQSEEKLVNFIAGCIQQSKQYFHAYEASSLDISPLLLYYGLTNLLAGASALLTGKIPKIEGHGLKMQETARKIGDIQIRPISKGAGALQKFADVFSDNCPIVNGADWSFIEILASIPDLKKDFENCYKDFPTFTIPTEVVRKPKYSFERIDPSDVSTLANLTETLETNILDFNKAYLEPQISPNQERVILFRRINGVDIGNYSIFGQKHLQVAHKKKSKLLNPSQVILMFMGLFTLGFISRYNPEIWNPFVRNDTTGERLVVEKFLEICFRYSPNIVLNALSNQRIQFLNELESGVEITEDAPPLTGEEISKIRELLENSDENR